MKKLLFLGCILVILKLTNVLNISWWLATLPFWLVPAAWVSMVIALIIMIIAAIIICDFDVKYVLKPLAKSLKQE